jgi:hypothetical protein
MSRLARLEVQGILELRLALPPFFLDTVNLLSNFARALTCQGILAEESLTGLTAYRLTGL